MKKWIITFTFLGGGSPAWALNEWGLHCHNDQGQSMEINHVFDQETQVKVALLAAPVSESFEGVRTGTDYFMNSTASGQNVSLAVVKPKDHGGRCGRCMTVAWNSHYYAKLTVGQQEYNFTCYQ